MVGMLTIKDDSEGQPPASIAWLCKSSPFVGVYGIYSKSNAEFYVFVRTTGNILSIDTINDLLTVLFFK